MFRSEKHNVFTEDVNEITLNANEDKRIQSIGSIETYAHETNEEIVHKKGETKCINKNTKNDQLLAISSQSFIQNIDNWRLWIWKTETII